MLLSDHRADSEWRESSGENRQCACDGHVERAGWTCVSTVEGLRLCKHGEFLSAFTCRIDDAKRGGKRHSISENFNHQVRSRGNWIAKIDREGADVLFESQRIELRNRLREGLHASIRKVAGVGEWCARTRIGPAGEFELRAG